MPDVQIDLTGASLTEVLGDRGSWRDKHPWPQVTLTHFEYCHPLQFISEEAVSQESVSVWDARQREPQHTYLSRSAISHSISRNLGLSGAQETTAREDSVLPALACVCAQLLSRVRVFCDSLETRDHPWSSPRGWRPAAQAPLSMGFPRQEDWSGCHCLARGSS